MPANSDQTDDSKATQVRTGRSYRCIYRAFLRACGERAELDVLKAAKVGGNNERSRQTYLGKLRNGVPVAKTVFTKLAAVLRCEPTFLYFTPEQQLPRWDSPSYRFALRVAELLADVEDGIPPIDPDTDEPTNVVQYAWDMADPVLDSMQLSFQEEREAFLFLRDYLMLVVEQPIETKRKHPRQLGVMIAGTTPKDDVIADIRARKAASLAAFDILQENYEDKNPFHICRIRALVPHRFDMYLDAVRLDETQWECLNPHEEDLQKRSWDGAIAYTAMELVRNVIDADFHLRKAIFPTYQQDMAFSAYYSRSRQLIEWVHHRSPTKFATWWNRFRDINTEELRKFVLAWSSKEPDWLKMREALELNLRRTESEIWEHYPNTLLPKSKRNGSKKTP